MSTGVLSDTKPPMCVKDGVKKVPTCTDTKVLPTICPDGKEPA
jgi:hypothetical protein